MKYTFYTIILIFLLGCVEPYEGELLFVEAESSEKFEYPYFLFIPNDLSLEERAFVIIEPNNSGFADDDFDKHIEKAKRTSSNDYYLGNYLSHELKYPLLVPVFPRLKSKWRIYTHALDRDVMLQKDNPLERLDKQLIEMFKDAQSRLQYKSIQTNNQFLLTGFSASGTFANRFALLHPESVKAVAAGGINGLLMLPIDSLGNEILKYPLGTADVETITNMPFDKESFIKTPQFYFMGSLDDNDAIPYEDGFDPNEREQIFRLLGKQMMPMRWSKSKELYRKQNVNAKFRTYENIGHEHPEIVKKEILEFFNEAIKEHGLN